MLLSTFLKDVNRTITKLLKLVLKQEKCAAYKTTLSFFFFGKKTILTLNLFLRNCKRLGSAKLKMP